MNKSISNLLIFLGIVLAYAAVLFGLLFLWKPAGIAWLAISAVAWVYWVIKDSKSSNK